MFSFNSMPIFLSFFLLSATRKVILNYLSCLIIPWSLHKVFFAFSCSPKDLNNWLQQQHISKRCSKIILWLLLNYLVLHVKRFDPIIILCIFNMWSKLTAWQKGILFKNWELVDCIYYLTYLKHWSYSLPLFSLAVNL